PCAARGRWLGHGVEPGSHGDSLAHSRIAQVDAEGAPAGLATDICQAAHERMGAEHAGCLGGQPPTRQHVARQPMTVTHPLLLLVVSALTRAGFTPAVKIRRPRPAFQELMGIDVTSTEVLQPGYLIIAHSQDCEDGHRCIEAGAFLNGHTVSEYHAYYLAFGHTHSSQDTLRLAHLPKTDHPLSRLSTDRDAIKADPRCAHRRLL